MERLVPRHGPLKQISNKMPSCIVLIKWLLVLEKVIVSYQRNDSTHFHVRKHVFASVTYRVWVTQRQLHNEKSLLAWVMTHMRSIPGSSPIIYRQLCAFRLLALLTTVSSWTRSLCSLYIAAQPTQGFFLILLSLVWIHPPLRRHCSNSEQMAVWHLLLCNFIILKYAKSSHRNIVHIRLEVKSE